MKGTLCLLLIFITVIIAGCNNKRKLLNDAMQCIEDSNYKKGIIICNEILAQDSTESEAYNRRGLCFESLKEFKNAADDYTRSIHFNPNDWRGYALRATLLCKEEHYEYSLADYHAALEHAPTDSIKGVVLTDRGRAYGGLHQLDKAIEDTKQALVYNPRNKLALTNLGEVLAESGKMSEALPYFEKAVEVDPGFTGGYVNLAFAYSILGDHRKAIEINTKIISKNSGEEFYAYNNRGYSKMQLNDFEGAMEDINRSIEINSRNSYAFRNRGLLYLKLKKNDEACTDFHTALRLDFTQQYGQEVNELVKKNCTK